MNDDKSAGPRKPENQQDEDAIAFGEGLFELARNGGTGPLNIMLDAGVPVDIRTNTGDSLLMLACSNGHPDTARMLLEKGANPDLRNSQLQTPLMCADSRGHKQIVNLLLEYGAGAGHPE